jgi:hypothetical protein
MALAPEEQALIQRIFLSRHFSYADSLRRILRYLCENASGPEAKPIKEYELAVFALGRPDSFDPKTDPVVRVSVASIRDRLRAYFENEGREEKTAVSVPKGRYLVLFAERTDVPASPQPIQPAVRQRRPALERFWRPYVTRPAGAEAPSNVVMYTEPLFFRDDEQGTYTRSLYVNDRAASPDELKKKVRAKDAAALRPCYHYLSAGEVHCSFALIRMFAELHAPLDIRNARLSAMNDFRQANLVLLGSTRTNHFMDAMQGGKGFLMTADAIENPQPRAKEEKAYRGRRYMDGKLPRFTEYCLVTRRPGLSPGTACTIFASNHGRAIQGVAHVLTTETQVEALYAAMELAGDAPLPDYFQVLFEVEMIDLDDEVVNVRHASHRILS